VVSRRRIFLFITLLYAGAGLICSGAETSVTAHPAVESYLRDRLTFWKDRLKLEAWSVTLTIAGPNDLRPGTLGNIHWDPDKKTAVIRVLSSAGTQDDIADMECTIVHELIHLEFASMPRTDESRIAEEVAVNNIADALLQQQRLLKTASIKP